ncbi:unnamed protein product [Toxocara canis]|uniref:Uncharacterized protein n=1 Tax=Toxocara canis TaxID=6265 RepID=A0A183VBD5_TOXCA|nr:unnamed protein product [Toxocara canis]
MLDTATRQTGSAGELVMPLFANRWARAYLLPEAVYSEYSMEPSETAVEFPQESVGIPGDTFHVCNDALPRFVDSLEVIGRVPCEPVPLDHLPREWQMIHSSSEASEDSGSFGEIDELDSITAKSIDTSAPSVKLSEAPHSEYYSHPPMSQYFVDKNLINIGKYCGNAVCLSQYLLDELNENAMEFSLFPPKLQDGVGETVDGGKV